MGILKKKSIQMMCAFRSVYNRGEILWNADKVRSLAVQKTADRTLTASADVEEGTKFCYHTKARLCWKEADWSLQPERVTCECPEKEQYKGLCKHLVAMLLAVDHTCREDEIQTFLKESAVGDSYPLSDAPEDWEQEENQGEWSQLGHASDTKWNSHLKELEQQGVVSRGMTNKASSSGRTFSYSGTSVMRESSKELLDAISGVALQERNRFCQELSGGEVSIEVTLHLEPNVEQIELRIGKGKMYIVKDIGKLVEDIRRQNFVQYGKNLQFVHTQSAFTRASLSLISFLLKAPTQRQSYSYWSSNSEKRYLELDATMLEELLLLFAGDSLWVKNCITNEKEWTPVKQEDPVLPLWIRGNEKEAKITVPEVILLEGVQGFYIWWEGCIYLCSEDFCRDMREIVKLMAVNKLRAERKSASYYSFLKPREAFRLCEKDYASFCSSLLPRLVQYMEVQVEGVDFTKYQIEEGSYELYLDLTEQGEVTCRAEARYGEKKHNLIHVAAIKETYRDVRSEYEIRTILEQYFPDKTTDHMQYLLPKEDDRLAALVEHGIDDLGNFAEVYVSEAFRQIRIAPSLRVTTGLSIQGNLLKVSWNVEGMSKEELYGILGAYHQKRKYYRLKSGELLNLSDAGLSVLTDMQRDLHLTKSQLREGMAELPVYRSLYLNALMKENAGQIQTSQNEQFQQFILNFDEQREKKYEIPDGIRANLREYQITGYRWACALGQMGFGGILADDMGLGKTLQMITYLCSLKGETHLVICPASLVYNWETEFQKFAPAMRVCPVVGNAEERRQLLEEWQDYDVLVTSYDLLKRDVEWYRGRAFGCEIIDEAQYIKNPSTQAAKSVKAIASRIRFALTGTPIENRLSELWSIFEYLMPGYLYSYPYFKEHFEEQILQKTQEELRALNRLHTMIAPFLLRRLKTDVLKELPDKIEEVVYTRMEREQEKLYRATEKNIVDGLKKQSGKELQEHKLQILAQITRLRQICCDPMLLYEDYTAGSAKLATCMELLKNAVEGGHRILVFSQFTSMLDLLARELDEEGIPFLLLTGSTTKAKRRELVERFQAGKADVFLISLKAGGTGLNLTAADMVVHYDPWWNVAAQNQATDRAHRIGQDKKVTVMKLIAKDTIEERILKLQEEKRDLADKIISAEGISLAALTKEELLGLFES
ncbi:MAG: DEAD/DEAH box helicase [Lachnospiraceae bacterium]|nr:DEAD/DEAH box helicase [Lachnospiraceae bacterium]